MESALSSVMSFSSTQCDRKLKTGGTLLYRLMLYFQTDTSVFLALDFEYFTSKIILENNCAEVS